MLQYSHILLVIDDHQVATRLSGWLRGYGYGVTWEVTGRSGLTFALNHEAHLFILGKRLPDMSGQQLAVALRQHEKEQPIIMLDNRHGTTEPLIAASSTIGQVTILNDRTPPETLVKSVRELLHWAYGKKVERKLLLAGDLIIDLDTEKVWRGNQPIPLTPAEFRILCYLARHPGETLGRQQIWQALGDAAQGENEDDSMVKAEVSRLRAKITSHSADSAMIVTVPGIGYRLVNRTYH